MYCLVLFQSSINLKTKEKKMENERFLLKLILIFFIYFNPTAFVTFAGNGPSKGGVPQGEEEARQPSKSDGNGYQNATLQEEFKNQSAEDIFTMVVDKSSFFFPSEFGIGVVSRDLIQKNARSALMLLDFLSKHQDQYRDWWQIKENRGRFHLYHGWVELILGNYKEARERDFNVIFLGGNNFGRWGRIPGNRANLIKLRAEALLRSKKYQEVVGSVAEVIDNSGAYGKYLEEEEESGNFLYYILGVANFELGNFKEAAKDFAKVIPSQDSLDIYKSYYWGMTYNRLGGYEAAISLFEKARNIGSVNGVDLFAVWSKHDPFKRDNLLYEMGLAYLRVRQYQSSLDCFVLIDPRFKGEQWSSRKLISSEWLDNQNNFINLRLYIAKALIGLGRNEEALSIVLDIQNGGSYGCHGSDYLAKESSWLGNPLNHGELRYCNAVAASQLVDGECETLELLALFYEILHDERFKPWLQKTDNYAELLLVIGKTQLRYSRMVSSDLHLEYVDRALKSSDEVLNKPEYTEWREDRLNDAGLRYLHASALLEKAKLEEQPALYKKAYNEFGYIYENQDYYEEWLSAISEVEGILNMERLGLDLITALIEGGGSKKEAEVAAATLKVSVAKIKAAAAKIGSSSLSAKQQDSSEDQGQSSDGSTTVAQGNEAIQSSQGKDSSSTESLSSKQPDLNNDGVRESPSKLFDLFGFVQNSNTESINDGFECFLKLKQIRSKLLLEGVTSQDIQDMREFVNDLKSQLSRLGSEEQQEERLGSFIWQIEELLNSRDSVARNTYSSNNDIFKLFNESQVLEVEIGSGGVIPLKYPQRIRPQIDSSQF